MEQRGEVVTPPPQQTPSFNFNLNDDDLDIKEDSQTTEQEIRNDIYNKLIENGNDGIFLYQLYKAYQKDKINFAQKWFNGVIKNPETDRPINPTEYLKLINKYKSMLEELGKKMNFNLIQIEKSRHQKKKKKK